MNDAPMGGIRSSAGGMQQERADEQRAAARNFAHLRFVIAATLRDLRRRQYAMRVRSRNHEQRAVVGKTIVQMQSNCQHVLQNLRGRLHMLDALLHRPRTKAWLLDALLYSDR